jgi:hypothetical protein
LAITRTGDWDVARRLLAAGATRLRGAANTALRQEAHALRNGIVRGLTQQAPGGQAIAPPAPLTLAKRQLIGRGGTKSLIVSGELRNSIAVLIRGEEVFVGVSRAARSGDGGSLSDLAELNEFGGPPVVIPITPAMQRFLAVLFATAGRPRAPGSGAGVVVVQVPARPFLRPAFEQFRVGASRRFLERVAREMGWG